MTEVMLILKSIERLEKIDGVPEDVKKELEVIKQNIKYNPTKEMFSNLGIFGF